MVALFPLSPNEPVAMQLAAFVVWRWQKPKRGRAEADRRIKEKRAVGTSSVEALGSGAPGRIRGYVQFEVAHQIFGVKLFDVPVGTETLRLRFASRIFRYSSSLSTTPSWRSWAHETTNAVRERKMPTIAVQLATLCFIGCYHLQDFRIILPTNLSTALPVLGQAKKSIHEERSSPA